MIFVRVRQAFKTAMLATCAAAVFACGAAVGAADLEGHPFPNRIQLDGTGLVLNGAGVRAFAAYRLYLAALYLPVRNEDGEAILRENRPSRIALHFLRELTAEQIATSIDDALRETLTPTQRVPLERRLKELGGILQTLPTLQNGAQIVIDYLPQSGTTIRVNGEPKGSIPGADFFQALLRTWIGERPRDTRLKAAMLGASQ